MRLLSVVLALCGGKVWAAPPVDMTLDAIGDGGCWQRGDTKAYEVVCGRGSMVRDPSVEPDIWEVWWHSLVRVTPNAIEQIALESHGAWLACERPERKKPSMATYARGKKHTTLARWRRAAAKQRWSRMPPPTPLPANVSVPVGAFTVRLDCFSDLGCSIDVTCSAGADAPLIEPQWVEREHVPINEGEPSPPDPTPSGYYALPNGDLLLGWNLPERPGFLGTES